MPKFGAMLKDRDLTVCCLSEMAVSLGRCLLVSRWHPARPSREGSKVHVEEAHGALITPKAKSHHHHVSGQILMSRYIVVNAVQA